MLMELVSHVALLANTSGPLLLELMKVAGSWVMVHLQHAPVSLGALPEIKCPRLWVRITSVSQA